MKSDWGGTMELIRVIFAILTVLVSGSIASSQAFARSPTPQESAYAGKVYKLIKERGFYPYKPGVAPKPGLVLVAFDVYRDGRIGHIQIIRSSGQPHLDAAAVGIIHSVPFPRPPASLNDPVKMGIPIRFGPAAVRVAKPKGKKVP
jgi:TonB family protein